MKFVCSDELKPVRATTGSAGYDFVMPESIYIPAETMIVFDTGVKVEGMKQDEVLLLYIRSSLGREGITLPNAVAVIDSDYKDSIHAFLYNMTKQPVELKRGQRYMQGIFTKYLKTEDDATTAERNGGIGSTGR